MLVWKGKGLLVLVAGFLGIFVGAMFESLNLPNTLQSSLMWLVAGSVSAGVNYLFCRFFISTEKRIYIDEQTGQRVEVMDNSSLFFIRNRIWTYIFGILFGVLGVLGLGSYVISLF